jgi:primosomal replication protein N
MPVSTIPERNSREKSPNWIPYIQIWITYTSNKEGTVFDIYLSILLNMVGLPICIPQVAITEHERLS